MKNKLLLSENLFTALSPVNALLILPELLTSFHDFLEKKEVTKVPKGAVLFRLVNVFDCEEWPNESVNLTGWALNLQSLLWRM